MYETGHAACVPQQDVNELCERLISVLCEQYQSVVNYAIDERPVLTLKADIMNINYDCYFQNNDVKIRNGSTVNLITGDDFFVLFCCECK